MPAKHSGKFPYVQSGYAQKDLFIESKRIDPVLSLASIVSYHW